MKFMSDSRVLSFGLRTTQNSKSNPNFLVDIAFVIFLTLEILKVYVLLTSMILFSDLI